jgi:sugar phosphate isomerase/epimerase
MKLGFLGDMTERNLKAAKEIGYTCLGIQARPKSVCGEKILTAGGIKEVVETMKKADLEISALGFYANFLDPNQDAATERIDHLKKVIEAAPQMGVGVVTTFAGRDPEKSIEENVPLFKEVFSPIAELAEKKKVKIAFENCPMMRADPVRGTNMAYSPQAWDLMFEAVPSEALGLELDPSHLYWLGIDHIKAIYDYGDRIYHIHAKDTEILQDQLDYISIYAKGWWRYRIPGWGEIDWQRFIAALLDVEYAGNIVIEHEDPVFHGDRFNEGLVLGYKHLSQFLPDA